MMRLPGILIRLGLVVLLGLALLGAILLIRPTQPQPGGPAPPTATTSAAAPATTVPSGGSGTNPFAGAKGFIDPASNARHQADTWRSSRPQDAALLDRIANQPQADWFGDWNPDIESAVAGRVTQIAAADALALLVAYNIPNRDCGQYSAGGAVAPDAYETWIRGFAKGIGSRRAAVVLEPDALGLLKDCLSAADQQARLDLLKDAVAVLKANPGTAVYLDAGNAHWIAAPDMAARLRSAGVDQADGFALNVSNYITTAGSIAYGKEIAAHLDGKHFIIDTSRNGAGPTADAQWCNPPGRTLGPAPTTATADPLVDAYCWIKRPGESDGTCNGGPPAGTWWPDRALELARLASP
jgi:endoglucanase